MREKTIKFPRSLAFILFLLASRRSKKKKEKSRKTQAKANGKRNI
jgi:hypothetical protein